jgi:hypothetical protein
MQLVHCDRYVVPHALQCVQVLLQLIMMLVQLTVMREEVSMVVPIDNPTDNPTLVVVRIIHTTYSTLHSIPNPMVVVQQVA